MKDAAANGDRVELVAAVNKLERACAELKQVLARVTTERDWYRQALYEKAREAAEFENVELEELEKTSAGPVKPLE